MLALFILFIAIVFWARSFLLRQHITISLHPLYIALALFIGIRILSGFLGVDPHKSFWGDALRLTGTWVWILFFITSMGLSLWANDKSRRLFVLWIGTLTASITALYGWLVQYAPNTFGVDVPTIGIEGRFIGLQGNATYFASYVMVGVFMTIGLACYEQKRARKIIASILFVFLCVTVAYAKTRATFLGVIFGLSIGMLVYLWHHKTKYVRWISLGVFTILVVTASLRVLIPSISLRDFSLSTTARNLVSLSGAPTRFYLWNVAWKGFKDRPLLGWGPENYEQIFAVHYPKELLSYSMYETWGERPHNIFLEHLSGVGVLGTMLFLSLFAVVIISAIKIRMKDPHDRALYMAMVGMWCGYGIFGLFTFDIPVVLFYLFAGTGILVSFDPRIHILSFSRFKTFRRVGAYCVTGLGIYGAFILFMIPLIESIHAQTTSAMLFDHSESVRVKEFAETMFSRSTIFRNDTLKVLADDIINNDGKAILKTDVYGVVVPVYISAFEDALKKHPDLFALQLRYAQLLAIAAQYIDRVTYESKSHSAFAKARELSAGRQVTEISESQLYVYFNDLTGLKELTERLSKSGDNAALTSWFLGVIASIQGDKALSGKYIAEAIDRGFRVPSSKDTLEFVLQNLEENNDYRHIVSVLRSVVTLDDQNRSLVTGVNYLRLAYALGNIARYDDARAAASRAVELDPTLETPVSAFLSQLELARQGKNPN